ncbi:MAG: hypothetical protein RSD27_11215 [Ruthenibacterium sp.]
MNTKRSLAFWLCISLILGLFSACGGDKRAVSVSASAPSASVSAPAAVSSACASSAAQTADSTASSTVSKTDLLADGIKAQVSLTVENEERSAVLVLTVPADWSYDNYGTFYKNDIKVASVVTLSKITNASVPFPDEMTLPYAHSESVDGPIYPAGYGLQQTLDRTIGANKNLARTYLYKTIPDSGTDAWYPHFTFYTLDDYVLQIHFYSFQETTEDALFDSILSSAALNFVS